MTEYLAIGVGVLVTVVTNVTALAYFLGGMKEKVADHDRRLDRVEDRVFPTAAVRGRG
jgi:hypothetical protein